MIMMVFEVNLQAQEVIKTNTNCISNKNNKFGMCENIKYVHIKCNMLLFLS